MKNIRHLRSLEDPAILIEQFLNKRDPENKQFCLCNVYRNGIIVINNEYMTVRKNKKYYLES